MVNAPVIMVTGQSDRSVVAESVKAGVIAFVVKPLAHKNLLGLVAKALRVA